MNRPSPGVRIARRALSILVAFAVVITLMFLGRRYQEREFQSLPPTERRALYERTLETLRTTCMRSTGPTFTDFCSEQAEFASRFPDCDADCLALISELKQRPTR